MYHRGVDKYCQRLLFVLRILPPFQACRAVRFKAGANGSRAMGPERQREAAGALRISSPRRRSCVRWWPLTQEAGAAGPSERFALDMMEFLW